MQVKSKIFPYPVINHNNNYSNFGDCDFKLYFEPFEDETSYILKNCHFETESLLINTLFDENHIEIVLIIECSETVYRKSIPLSREGQNIQLLKVDFTNKVDISMFAYAKHDFVLSSDEFEDDYRNISFDIEKYDIIGANDGFSIRFTHEETEDNLVQSIFSVIRKEDLKDGTYIVDCDAGRKIVISLSVNDYKNYKIIYTAPAYKEVFFNMLLIPALIEGLSLCRIFIEDETKDTDDIVGQYPWFNSIRSAYFKLKGTELTISDLKQISPVSLAQELMGKPFGSALSNLVNETTKTEGDDENE